MSSPPALYRRLTNSGKELGPGRRKEVTTFEGKASLENTGSYTVYRDIQEKKSGTVCVRWNS